MTSSHKFTLIVLACVLCISSWVGHIAISEHNNKVRAELNEQNQAKDIQADAATIRSLQAAIASRNATVQKEKVRTVTLIRTVQTPAEIVTALPKVISLPDAPVLQAKTNSLIIPARDTKSLFDTLVNCKLESSSLFTCNRNAIDYHKELAEQDAEIRSEKNIASNWKQAAKGGTIIHRVLNDAKYVAIGAGVGFIASKVFMQKSNPSTITVNPLLVHPLPH